MIQLKVQTKKPWSAWFVNYRRDWLRPDLVALALADLLQATPVSRLALLPVATAATAPAYLPRLD